MNGVIYVVRNKVNGKHYVGQTIQKFKYRKQQHESGRDCPGSAIDNAIQKYGSDNFTWNIIENDIDDQDILNQLERLHISRYESSRYDWGYNIQDGGSNGSLSESTKQKISESLTGRFRGEDSPNYGRTFKHTKETLQKFSQRRTGKWRGTVFDGWRRVNQDSGKTWKTAIRWNRRSINLGLFPDPISGEIVYEFVRHELYD